MSSKKFPLPCHCQNIRDIMYDDDAAEKKVKEIYLFRRENTRMAGSLLTKEAAGISIRFFHSSESF